MSIENVDTIKPAAERFNLPLFGAVIAAMARQPERVWMHRVSEAGVHACGTVGCIAGHAAWLAHPSAQLHPKGDWTLKLPGAERWQAVVPVAREALGLTEREGDSLFFNYSDACNTTEQGTQEHAEAAIAWVKTFVKGRAGVEL